MSSLRETESLVAIHSLNPFYCWNFFGFCIYLKIFSLILLLLYLLKIFVFLWIASGYTLAMTVRGSGIVIMSSLRDSALASIVACVA